MSLSLIEANLLQNQNHHSSFINERKICEYIVQFRALLYQLEDLNFEAQRLAFCFIAPCGGLIPSIRSPGDISFVGHCFFESQNRNTNVEYSSPRNNSHATNSPLFYKKCVRPEFRHGKALERLEAGCHAQASI